MIQDLDYSISASLVSIPDTETVAVDRSRLPKPVGLPSSEALSSSTIADFDPRTLPKPVVLPLLKHQQWCQKLLRGRPCQ